MRIVVKMQAAIDVPLPEGEDLDEFMELNYFGSIEDFMKLVQLGNESTGWDTEWEDWYNLIV